jgi:hypothetical protein
MLLMGESDTHSCQRHMHQDIACVCVRAGRLIFASRLLSDVLFHFHSPVRGHPSSGVFFDGSCLSVLPQLRGVARPR